MSQSRLDRKEIEDIFEKKFQHSPADILALEKGDVNEMYVITSSKNNKRFVLRVINDSSLNNELFFFEKAKEVNASVPQTYKGGKTSCNRDYYFMDYIQSENNPRKSTEKSLKLLSKNLKKLHTVKFNEFGKLINNNWASPKFSDPDLHSWIKKETNELIQEFEKLKEKSAIPVLNKVLKHLEFIPNHKKSVLVHGDLGFGNTIMTEDNLYLIDPGWFIAMTPLYEIAKFDHKYYGLPEKKVIIKRLHQNYFNSKLNKDEKLELFMFRVIHSAITYWWFLKKDNPKYKEKRDRFKRNAQGFNYLLSTF